MTPAKQVAIAIYRKVYQDNDNHITYRWHYEVKGIEGITPIIHDWDGRAHKELLESAEKILYLVDYDLSKALKIIDIL